MNVVFKLGLVSPFELARAQEIHQAVQVWKTFFLTFRENLSTSIEPSLHQDEDDVSQSHLQDSNDFSSSSQHHHDNDDLSSHLSSLCLTPPSFKTCQIVNNHDFNSSIDKEEIQYPHLLTTPYMKIRKEEYPSHDTSLMNASHISHVHAHEDSLHMASPTWSTTITSPHIMEKENEVKKENEEVSSFSTPNKSITHQYEEENSPATPKMASPLLSTRLRAVSTPRTPLSSRLSRALPEKQQQVQQPTMTDATLGFEEEEDEIPEFKLDLFPSVFQVIKIQPSKYSY